MKMMTRATSWLVLAGVIACATNCSAADAQALSWSTRIWSTVKDNPAIFVALAALPVLYIYAKHAKTDFKAHYIEVDGVKTLVYFVDDTMIGQLPSDAGMIVNDEGRIDQLKKAPASGWLGRALAMLKPLRKTATTIGVLMAVYRLMAGKIDDSSALAAQKDIQSTLLAIGK